MTGRQNKEISRVMIHRWEKDTGNPEQNPRTRVCEHSQKDPGPTATRKALGELPVFNSLREPCPCVSQADVVSHHAAVGEL